MNIPDIWVVFQYTRRAAYMIFQVLFAQMETTSHAAIHFVLKLDDGSASVMRRRHLILTQSSLQIELECLRSEIPPAAPWLPILVIHIRSQVKTRQSQIYKF